jgi:hypothetical protein
MGRVQGGARAAFATPSWGPSRVNFIPEIKKALFEKKCDFFSKTFLFHFAYIY